MHARQPWTLRLRCCSSASASKITVARPDVPTRMLNGGISLSAIFMDGQLKPQHRLTATSMSRAVALAVSCGDGFNMRGKSAGSCRRKGDLCSIGADGERKGRGPRNCQLRSDVSSCCSAVDGVLRNRAIFVRLWGAPASFHENAKSH